MSEATEYCPRCGKVVPIETKKQKLPEGGMSITKVCAECRATLVAIYMPLGEEKMSEEQCAVPTRGEFFERLRERARHIIFGEATSYPNEHVFNAGINATIEALKEMEISPTRVCYRCGAIQGRQVATRDGRHYDDVRVFGTLDNHKE